MSPPSKSFVVVHISKDILDFDAYHTLLPKTATVVFDFDACEYTALIKTSIQAFTFSNEINSIVETHLDPVLDRATIFPESFTHNIKSAIVSATEAKVNEAKAAVIAQLDALFESCGRRRLGEVAELPQDGSQRMLAADGLKFGDLATSIQVIDGVVSFVVICLFFVLFMYQVHLTFVLIQCCEY